MRVWVFPAGRCDLPSYAEKDQARRADNLVIRTVLCPQVWSLGGGTDSRCSVGNRNSCRRAENNERLEGLVRSQSLKNRLLPVHFRASSDAHHSPNVRAAATSADTSAIAHQAHEKP